MHLRIHHRTDYQYDSPPTRLCQALRLWPGNHAGQSVRSWRARINGQVLRPQLQDGFGNSAASHTVEVPVDRLLIEVEGEVDTRDTAGVTQGAVEVLPPFFFLRGTELTAADEAIIELAESHRNDQQVLDGLHQLMSAVRARIDYRPSSTESETTAAAALAQGAGVCQDHAHVMISAARVLGRPARYISGYLWTGDADQQMASHAWAEIDVPGLGWVGFDAANCVCPTDAYVRLAVGRDYLDAAPIRGLRQGGDAESMAVTVQVVAASQQ